MIFTPAPPYQSIEEEFEARIKKAFSEDRDGYVYIDSRRQAFQFAMSKYGQEKGWLTGGDLVDIDDQYSQLRFYLTPEGKTHFFA